MEEQARRPQQRANQEPAKLNSAHELRFLSRRRRPHGHRKPTTSPPWPTLPWIFPRPVTSADNLLSTSTHVARGTHKDGFILMETS
jgi:hypothetical protein